jgi:hypothetical protein
MRAPPALTEVESTFRPAELCDNAGAMIKPVEDVPQRTYRWQWFLLAAVVLGIVLAIIWVGFAAYHEKEERDFSAPLPVQGH